MGRRFNSDHRLLNAFVAWVRRFLITDAEFVCSLNLHADNDEGKAKQCWAERLDIDPIEFTRSFIKPEGTGHRKNHLAEGVCRVRVRRSADAWLTTMRPTASRRSMDLEFEETLTAL